MNPFGGGGGAFVGPLQSVGWFLVLSPIVNSYDKKNAIIQFGGSSKKKQFFGGSILAPL